MRVAFTSVPAHGHVLPIVPLARAARDAGETVTVATTAEFGELVAPLTLEAVGPSLGEIVQESHRRVPAADRGTGMHAAGFADFFGATRIDLTFADLRGRLTPAPHLIVAERDDLVGPLVAADLGIPWVRVHFSPSFPPDVTEAMQRVARQRAQSLAIEPTEPIAEVDCWPEALAPGGWQLGPGRIAMRTEAYRRETPPTHPAPRVRAERRKILMTTGTMVDDPAVILALTTALADVEIDIRLTGRRGQPWPLDDVSPRVDQVGFAPLAELLDGIDAAVVAGGAGTVAGCLAQATPLIIYPQVYDQFAIAELATGAGAAITIASPEQLLDAVTRILAEPSYARAAAGIAADIAQTDSPAQAWRAIRDRLTGR